MSVLISPKEPGILVGADDALAGELEDRGYAVATAVPAESRGGRLLGAGVPDGAPFLIQTRNGVTQYTILAGIGENRNTEKPETAETPPGQTVRNGAIRTRKEFRDRFKTKLKANLGKAKAGKEEE